MPGDKRKSRSGKPGAESTQKRKTTGRQAGPSSVTEAAHLSELTRLQRGVGNRGVVQILQRNPDVRAQELKPTNGVMVLRQGLLNSAEEASAINYTNRRYDLRSIMVIQDITGAAVDGSFTGPTAEAVAKFQDRNPPLVVDGKVGPNTINPMVTSRAAAGRHEHAIQLVIDLFNLKTTRDTLSVHFDSSLGSSSATSFESGNLRVIRVGPTAFASAADLRTAIQDGLDAPAPPGAALDPRPTHLTRAEERTATRENRKTFTDPRAIFAIQGLVETTPDAIFGPDTAERIAAYQDSSGLPVNGIVGEETLREMVADFDLFDEQNAAIRLIIDFYNLSDYDALLDIRFDSSVPSNARTSGVIPGPSIVRIGSAGFSQGFEGLVHTIAHELEHVRQRKEGILSSNVREFLAEAIEIMSVGMPEEGIGGMMSDARRALNRFNAMTAAEQREHWERFEEVREQVRDRFDASTGAEHTTHQGTMAAYDAVAEPAPAP